MTATTVHELVQLDVPPDFHEVPLDAAVEDRVAARTDVLDVLGLDDPEQREGVGLYLEALAHALRDGPVAGTAFCAVELDGKPSTATLTVATRAHTTGDPLVTLAGLAEALRREAVHAAVTIERLGAQHGVVALRGNEPSGLSEVTIAVPLSAAPLVVWVTLATPCVDDFGTYARVARDVAASARVVRGSTEHAALG